METPLFERTGVALAGGRIDAKQQISATEAGQRVLEQSESSNGGNCGAFPFVLGVRCNGDHDEPDAEYASEYAIEPADVSVHTLTFGSGTEKRS